MLVNRRTAMTALSVVTVLLFSACTTELDRTRVETLAKVAGDDAWGDRIWGPSADPLPDTFIPVDPVPPETGWRRVAHWDGNGARTTELFSVDAEWQIVWQSGARADDSPLRIRAFAIPGDVMVANVSQDGASPVSALHLKSGGTFYLRVDGTGGPWQVSVEVPSSVAGDR